MEAQRRRLLDFEDLEDVRKEESVEAKQEGAEMTNATLRYLRYGNSETIKTGYEKGKERAWDQVPSIFKEL